VYSDTSDLTLWLVSIIFLKIKSINYLNYIRLLIVPSFLATRNPWSFSSESAWLQIALQKLPMNAVCEYYSMCDCVSYSTEHGVAGCIPVEPDAVKCSVPVHCFHKHESYITSHRLIVRAELLCLYTIDAAEISAERSDLSPAGRGVRTSIAALVFIAAITHRV